jgi:hypothetical protein
MACGHRGELALRVLAVVEGENTTMAVVEYRLRCHRCSVRIPPVGLQTQPRLTPYKG